MEHVGWRMCDGACAMERVRWSVCDGACTMEHGVGKVHTCNCNDCMSLLTSNLSISMSCVQCIVGNDDLMVVMLCGRSARK